MAAVERVVIRPQDGPQMRFLSSPADIVIYGGAAGGGKTWGILAEPLRHVANPQFGGVIFRRNTVQVRNEGGLWDESEIMYPVVGGKPRSDMLEWTFPSRATMKFAHLEHEQTVLNWQGSQIPFIGFDELTHFTEKQFWYMISRNRSMCGVRPYVRATCNPDSESWVADFISWYIDQDTGLPIPERCGVVRYFIRLGSKIIWADAPEGLSEYKNPATGDALPAKSFTFIAATLYDNKILMAADPGYLANLLSLPPVERERLLGGNWKIRRGDDDFFPIDNLLVDGRPVPFPAHCDGVFAVMDTATKTGTQHDGTAVLYVARSKFSGHPMVILDYDYFQVEGAMLETKLPAIFKRLEELALECKARMGSLGVWIEDKSAGEILLQQAARRGLRAHKIDSRLTALGKDERALSVSGYYHRGMAKISEHAFHKVVTFKESTKNHLIAQVTNFRIGDKNAAKRADDLVDCTCYSLSLALGDGKGF